MTGTLKKMSKHTNKVSAVVTECVLNYKKALKAYLIGSLGSVRSYDGDPKKNVD